MNEAPLDNPVIDVNLLEVNTEIDEGSEENVNDGEG